MLAWKYLYDDEQPPLLLLHVEDRDLWKFKLDKTREIQAALFSYPYDFAVWSELMELDQSGLDRLAKEGEALERKHFKDIHELLKLLKRDMIIGGITVPVASLPYTMVSDAANIMAENAPFAACYWDTDSRRIFGLRANANNPNRIDVSKIAEIYSGGGHVDAAGFSVGRGHPLAKS
jgi:oligoribonuclease NrnB/cAMP/cGMP phosphodiesterase (DHH superfamily)